MKQRNWKLSNADIALAMELRGEGMYWYNIAKAFGVDRTALARAVRKAEIHGMKPQTKAILTAGCCSSTSENPK